MPYIVCMEEREGRWVAHVPDLPGCFAAHQQRERAVQAIPSAVESYVEWCRNANIRISGLTGPMIVAEVIREWEFEDGQLVHAFFASDRPSVLEDELPQYQSLLVASHAHLLEAIAQLDIDDIYRPMPPDDWSIAAGLEELSSWEQWYWDRFGLAAPTQALPGDPFARVEKIREHQLDSLQQLAARKSVVTMAGETWSARKILRATLWKERELAHGFINLARRMP